MHPCVFRQRDRSFDFSLWLPHDFSPAAIHGGANAHRPSMLLDESANAPSLAEQINECSRLLTLLEMSSCHRWRGFSVRCRLACG